MQKLLLLFSLFLFQSFGFIQSDSLIQPPVRKSSGGILTTSLQVLEYHLSTPLFSFNTRSYEHQIPGPTLRVRTGDVLKIQIQNKLGSEENSYACFIPNRFHSPNTTNLHVHGLHVSPEGMSDNMFRYAGPEETLNYEYHIPEDHMTGTFFYHPHYHGSTALQIGGGMAGALIIEDDPLSLDPNLAVMEEVIMVFQHFIFQPTIVEHMGEIMVHNHDNLIMVSSMSCSDMDMDFQTNETNLTWYLINGQWQPTLSMRPREFKRFRMINAGGSEILEIIIDSSECEMYVLAMDGAYLSSPWLRSRIVLFPGSRADVAVRCSNIGTFAMIAFPDPIYDSIIGAMSQRHNATLGFISVFGPPLYMNVPTLLPSLPKYLTDLRDEPTPPPEQQFVMQYNHIMTPEPPHIFSINGEQYMGPDHPGIIMPLNKLQQWTLRNSEMMVIHPFHIHTNHFQIYSYFIDSTQSNVDISDAVTLQIGMWRDTVPVFSTPKRSRQHFLDTLEMVIRFKPDRFTGTTLHHCHISSHSDMGMMQAVKIIESPPEGITTSSSPSRLNFLFSFFFLFGTLFILN